MSLKKYLEKFAGDPPSHFKPVDQRGEDETVSVGPLPPVATSGDEPPEDSVDAAPQTIPPRPKSSAPAEQPENLSPTTGDMFKWLAPMGIGGAAGAGIQAWRRSRQVDALMDQGFTEQEAEELVDTSVGSGAVLGAGLGAGYKYVSDNHEQLRSGISDKLETLKDYFKQK